MQDRAAQLPFHMGPDMRQPFRSSLLWPLAGGLFAAFLLVFGSLREPVAAQSAGPLYVITLQGTITSVSTDYARRALREAEAAGATALLIELSSNGGVLRDLRAFAGELADARIPVAVYVTPSGAQSGAAGAFLLSAAHLSALAPGTSFGSPYPLGRVDEALSQQTRDMVLDTVAEQLRDWNTRHGRNTSWLDTAVREGVIFNNEQAIAQQPPVVDFVVVNRDELLTRMEGRDVRMADGSMVRLSTIGRTATPIEPTLVESIWLTLADPTVAFALLVLGAMAIYLELASPGIGMFAASGVVLLLISALGFIVLPIQWWSMLLLLAGLALIGIEFFAPTHGGFMVAGLTLLVIGALNLIDPTQAPGAGVAGWVIGVVGAGLVAAALAGLVLGLRSRSRPVVTGDSALIGKIGEVRRRLEPRGMIFVDGALWQAISEGGIVERGDYVRVVGIHQLQLIVRPLDEE
jgi:membrane-bound serine protease (ClpP class)